jgi:hypothetical protein
MRQKGNKKMNKTIRDFAIPLLAGVIFWLLYFLLAVTHIYLWLIFLFSYGLWFSIAIVKLVRLITKISFTDGVAYSFFAGGILIYGLTLAYISKNYEMLIDVRTTTFLAFNGISNLLLVHFLLKLNVRLYDYLLLFFYGVLINYLFTERHVNALLELDIMLSLWIISFLTHIVVISRRTL